MKMALTHSLALLAVLALLTEAKPLDFLTKARRRTAAHPKDGAVPITLEDSEPAKDRQNSTRPKGVFLFDDNCLWFLHGKGKLIAKLNCVTPEKEPPLIVATRRNGRLHYKLHKGPMRPGKLGGGRRRVSKTGQIPLKCFYRYDDKGVFYLTRCYTRAPGYGPVEMHFHGHVPGDKRKRTPCRRPRCFRKKKMRRHRRRKHGRRARARLLKRKMGARLRRKGHRRRQRKVRKGKKDEKRNQWKK